MRPVRAVSVEGSVNVCSQDASFVVAVIKGMLEVQAMPPRSEEGAAASSVEKSDNSGGGGEGGGVEAEGGKGGRSIEVVRSGELFHSREVYKEFVEQNPRMQRCEFVAVNRGAMTAQIMCVESTWYKMVLRSVMKRCTNTHKHTNKQTQNKHKHTHTQTHKHTNTQIHTHTHTHTFMHMKSGICNIRYLLWIRLLHSHICACVFINGLTFIPAP